MMSSMSAGSSCGTLARAAAIIWTVRSSGRMLTSEPLKARPIGERAMATTTASAMMTPWEGSLLNRTVAYATPDIVLTSPIGHFLRAA